MTMWDPDSQEGLRRALKLLERSVRHETLRFEASVYADPFLPKEPAESARVFAEHCERLNEYLDDQTLRHFCWMGVPQGNEQFTSFLRFENGQATPYNEKLYLNLLRDRVLPFIDSGRLYDLMPFSTPQQILGPKCVTCYVVLEGGDLAEVLSDRPPNVRKLMEHSEELPNQWPDDFIYCDALFLSSGNKGEMAAALTKKLTDRRVHFEAYHIIAGIPRARFSEFYASPTVARTLTLATLQFQREWGSRDQEIQKERALRESKLRQVSDRLSTFDQVLHSGLNALRSIGSELACQDFSTGTPPSVLRYRLVRNEPSDHASDITFDERAEKRLLDTLGRIWRGEEATAAALSLGRLLAHQKLVKGTSSEEPTDLTALVDRAAALLTSYDQAARKKKAFTIEFSRSQLSKAVIPAGYLGTTLLSVLIYELLLNAYNHAAQPIDIRVRADGDDGQVCLFVRSRVEPGKEWLQEETVALPAGTARDIHDRKSFLLRFAEVENVLHGGLAIRTTIVHEQDEWYEAELCMRGLTTADGHIAHPRWETEP